MLDANTQTFPVLTDTQIERVRPFGKQRKVEAGEILFRPGDTGVPFFVLLSGTLEIVQPSLTGELPITTHHGKSFTGELNMISGQPSLVIGRMGEAGEVLEISQESFRMMIARDAELSEVVMRAFILRRLALVTNHLGNVIIMGSRYCANTLRLREFLVRNSYPHTYVDLETDKTSQELLDRFHIKSEDVPVVICDGRNVLRNPSIQELADCLGLNASIDGSKPKDVVIVGAGPAGLAAAVYAASEGLDSLLIETEAPGGQAGSSSKIENYLGFPMGVSGQELASRAIHQAQKFGAQMMVARSVVRLDCSRHPYQVVMQDGVVITAKSIVIATGAQYNKPPIPNLKSFEGQGVYYGATHMESQLCQSEEVIVVGGGNSAGQAAVFLAGTAAKVYMLVRSSNLSDTMSRYLIQRISDNPKIELHYNTEIVRVEGGAHLEQVEWRNRATGESEVKPLRHVFIMAGASPRTDWLRGCLALDEKGFILTGRDLLVAQGIEPATAWTASRPPQMLETSLPGVFAVGDVREGSIKRAASAVGKGSAAISFVHRVRNE
jgi:thioredoxin reductase (NADPH)